MTAPTVSLCMIVRDEEELLPRFLESAAGLWDELCVVDTGSRDGTVALLEQAGARVVRRPWDDDFAAARNASLALAQGEWILVLDADELVSPDFVAQVRALVTRESVGAATVTMRNRLPHGHQRESRLLRLFRRDPSIAFRFPIHEDATDSVLALLARTGKGIDQLSAPIEHLGYTRARAAAKEKKARDRRLLEACVARDPSDLYAWFKLLELARFWGDRALWRDAALPAAVALKTAAAVPAHFGGELVALIAQGVYPAGSAEAVAFLDAWEGRLAPSAAFHLCRAEQRELRSEWRWARVDFERCLSLPGTSADPQLATTRPLLGLARVAIAEGNTAEAWGHVRRALEASPTDPEALLAAAVLMRARGGADGVRQFAADHAALHGESKELHLALGEEAFISGEIVAAVAELQRAASDPPTGRAGLLLAQSLLAAGELGPARRLATALVADLPEAALGVLVCNLTEGKDTDLEVDIDEQAANDALRSWVDALHRGRQTALLAQLRAFSPAVAEVFPWLTEYADAAPTSWA